VTLAVQRGAPDFQHLLNSAYPRNAQPYNQYFFGTELVRHDSALAYELSWRVSATDVDILDLGGFAMMGPYAVSGTHSATSASAKTCTLGIFLHRDDCWARAGDNQHAPHHSRVESLRGFRPGVH
jgi:hypothetical protein